MKLDPRLRLRELRDAAGKAFASPSGWMAATFGVLFVLFLTVTLPNLKLLAFTFGASEFSLGLKLRTAAQVLWNGRAVFMYPGGWAAIPLALAFGLNAALIVRYLRDRVEVGRAAGVSAVGIVVGLFGVGCAACGTVLLSSLLGLGAVAALPFHGQEFAWVGLAVTLAATFSISRKIVDAGACRIPERKAK